MAVYKQNIILDIHTCNFIISFFHFSHGWLVSHLLTVFRTGYTVLSRPMFWPVQAPEKLLIPLHVFLASCSGTTVSSHSLCSKHCFYCSRHPRFIGVCLYFPSNCSSFLRDYPSFHLGALSFCLQQPHFIYFSVGNIHMVHSPEYISAWQDPHLWLLSLAQLGPTKSLSPMDIHPPCQAGSSPVEGSNLSLWPIKIHLCLRGM